MSTSPPKLQNPTKLFPMFITEDLSATKAFYLEALGAKASSDLETYLQVQLGADAEGPELAFMTPDAFPDGQVRPTFGGEGVIVSIPTADADATYDHLVKQGAQVLAEPSDKPWGWRSFLARDPNGVVLDFFHVVAAAPSPEQNA